MTPLRKWIVCFQVFLLCGCSQPIAGQPAVGTLPLFKVSSAAVCGGPDGPCLEWIETVEYFQNTINRSSRPFSVKGPPLPPDVDFARFAVLRIAMGTRPTGGYELVLIDTQARIQKDTAVIRVDWIEPAPDAMVTQMVTSPCLLVHIPRGDYRQVEVQDQNGTIRCRINIR